MESNISRRGTVPGSNAARRHGTTSKESLAFVDYPPPSFCFTHGTPCLYPLDTPDKEATYSALEFGPFHGTRHDDAKWRSAYSTAPFSNSADTTVWSHLTEPLGTEHITFSKEWTEACHVVHSADHPAVSALWCRYRRRTTMAEPGFVSPFTRACDILTPTPFPRYRRPHNGQLNSYVKFVWAKPEPCSTNDGSAWEPHIPSTNGSAVHSDPSQICYAWRTSYELDCYGQTRRNQVERTGTHQSKLNPKITHEGRLLAAPLLADNPRMQPSQFGLMATMDGTDRKLWQFCTWT